MTFVLVRKLQNEYRRIQNWDVFVARTKGCAATLWQKRPIGPRMLCRLPPKFCDAFVTIQEWSLQTDDESQSLRLDFLNRISLPSTTRFESPAFYAKMRAALLGGLGLVTKDIQSYHLIDRLYTPEEERSILNELGFNSRPPVDAIHAAFAAAFPAHHAANEAKVVVKELLDETETIPLATLTAEAATQLHSMRHQRYLRRHQGI